MVLQPEGVATPEADCMKAVEAEASMVARMMTKTLPLQVVRMETAAEEAASTLAAVAEVVAAQPQLC